MGTLLILALLLSTGNIANVFGSATVVGIIRLRFLSKFGKTGNHTWEYLEINRWSVIEIYVGEVCACMPSLRLVVAHLFPRVVSTSRRYYSKYVTGKSGKSGNKNNGPELAGSYVVSRADPPEVHINHGEITCERAYAVEYGETDETQPAHLKYPWL